MTITTPGNGSHQDVLKNKTIGYATMLIYIRNQKNNKTKKKK